MLARFLIINCLMFTIQAVVPSGWKTTSNFTSRQTEENDHYSYQRSSHKVDSRSSNIVESIHWEVRCSHYTNAAIWKDLKADFWYLHKHKTSAKIRNKAARSKNGNIIPKIKIIHWNVGARLWCSKLTDIEALLLQEKPQLCFISEANLWNHIDIEDRQIPGYTIILPNTMSSLGHARIVLLVMDGIIVTKLDELMDQETAAIWIRIGNGRHNSVIVGGLYREHSQLGQVQASHMAGKEK